MWREVIFLNMLLMKGSILNHLLLNLTKYVCYIKQTKRQQRTKKKIIRQLIVKIVTEQYNMFHI